jgi:hypothetical protein
LDKAKRKKNKSMEIRIIANEILTEQRSNYTLLLLYIRKGLHNFQLLIQLPHILTLSSKLPIVLDKGKRLIEHRYFVNLPEEQQLTNGFLNKKPETPAYC